MSCRINLSPCVPCHCGHEKNLELQKQRRRWWVFGLVGLSLSVIALAPMARAVDVQPPQILDGRGTGKVAASSTLKPGTYAVGVHATSDISPVPNQVYDKDFVAGRTAVERINRTTASFSLGVTEYLDLSLAVRGTSETLSPDYQDQIRHDDSSQGENLKFSGASILAKARLIKDGNFAVLLAPFVESGSGSGAESSLARSLDPKAGWMGILSYGESGIAMLTMNAGYRYRQREDVGQLRLRNELFYQGTVEGFFTRSISAFAGGQGRVVTMARTGDEDVDGKLRYSPFESSEWSTGVNVKMDVTSISVYGGSRLQERALGHGKSFVGVSLAYQFGDRKRSYSQSVELSERSKKASDTSTDTVKAKAVNKGVTYTNTYTDPALESFDPDAAFMRTAEGDWAGDEADDFKALEQRRLQERKDPNYGKPSSDAIVEDELRRLRDAEAKQKQLEAERQKLADEVQRKSGKSRFQEERQAKGKFRDELRDQVDGLPAITEEDVSWNGLED